MSNSPQEPNFYLFDFNFNGVDDRENGEYINVMFKSTNGYGGFSVKDLSSAKDFYLNVLGLEVSEDEMGLMISLPQAGKMFVYPKENHEPATYTVMNLIVPDITQAVEALSLIHI